MSIPMAATFNVTVNAQTRTLPGASTLADLMALIDTADGTEPARQATATAVNGAFVSLHQRANCMLREGDQVTCFQLIVGG